MGADSTNNICWIQSSKTGTGLPFCINPRAGGNVGINTTSPTSTLTVAGNIQSTGYTFIKSTSVVIPANTANINYKIASISGGIYTCKFRVQTGDGTFISHQMLTFEISNAYGNTNTGGPSIRLQNSTYNPSVNGDIASILFCCLSDSSQEVYLVMKSSTATYTATIYLIEDSSGTVNLLSPASGTPSGSVYTYSVQSSISTLIGNESTQLTMTHNGNVGINTTSPTNTLSISGNVNINSTTSTLLYNTTGYQKLVISGDAYGSNGDPTSYGQMIICGTTDQTKRLGFMMDTTNNIGVIQAGHAGSSVYPLSLGAGNVGINTTSPAFALDVVGTLRTTAQTGQTTNFSGQASYVITVDLSTYQMVEIILRQSYTVNNVNCNIRYNGTSTFGEYGAIFLKYSALTSPFTDTSGILFQNIETGVNDSFAIIKVCKGTSGGRNTIDIRGSYCWAGFGQTRVDATANINNTLPGSINISVPSGTMSGSYTIRNIL